MAMRRSVCHVVPRRLALILGSLASLCGVTALLAYHFSSHWQWTIILAAFSPYMMCASMVGAGLFALARSRTGSIINAVIIVMAVVTQLPLFLTSGQPLPGPRLTVFQANLEIGAADAHSLVRTVVEEQVDLFTAQELTVQALFDLDGAGINDQLPYRTVEPHEGGAGTGLWSRYPLTNVQRYTDYSFAVLSADVVVPNGPTTTAVAAHVLPPWPYPSDIWSDELHRMRSLLDMLSSDGNPVVVGGDFNATLDQPQFRNLIGSNYSDATSQSGSGILNTYPTDRPLPPLLALDHVLLHKAHAVNAFTVGVTASDHRGLITAINIPAVL